MPKDIVWVGGLVYHEVMLLLPWRGLFLGSADFLPPMSCHVNSVLWLVHSSCMAAINARLLSAVVFIVEIRD